MQKLQKISRLDLVWDVYKSDSLKTMTRDNRGHGQRRHVSDNTKIPRNWKQFLRVNDNKSELFRFLAKYAVDLKHNGTIISTYEEGVLCNKECDITNLAPCTHEEADTRLLLHAADAVIYIGYK